MNKKLKQLLKKTKSRKVGLFIDNANCALKRAQLGRLEGDITFSLRILRLKQRKKIKNPARSGVSIINIILSYLIILSSNVKSICRDALFTNPTYNPERSRRGFDFYFKVVLPRKQKEREIIQRDYLGRIVASKVPEYTKYYAKQ